MSEYRPVKITAQDIEYVEEALYALYRAREGDLALKLGALALRMRAGTGFELALPPADNVVEIDRYSRRVEA